MKAKIEELETNSKVNDFKKGYQPRTNVVKKGNYWGSSVLISMQQVNYWSHIRHLSNTLEKMGLQWSSASAIYSLQESL